MSKTKKPRIVVSLLTENDKIIRMTIKDIVKKVGNTGYIALSPELIGKYISVNIEVLK